MRTERPRAAGDAHDDRDGHGRFAVLAFLGMAVVLFAVSAIASWSLATPGLHVVPPFRGWRWLHGWAQWDSGWYASIAESGYRYVRGQQSSVAFFPAYPMLMRAVAVVVGNPYVAGIVVTLASGAAATRLFFDWLCDRMTRRAAWAGLGLLLVYPYGFFLYGAVYPTAFLLMTSVAAFALLEHDHPWLAGIVGASTTAAGPSGVLLLVGLALRAIERHRRFGGDRAGWSDAGVLLAGLGVAGWSLYLWRRFGDPFAFVTVQEAWEQESGPRTWLKAQFFDNLSELPDRQLLGSISYLAHPVLTLAAVSLVPRVFRRLGWGYGVYTLLVVVVPAFSTKDFFGMSRYLLAAFPVFAVAGELVAERPRLVKVIYPAAALGLVVLTAAYSQAQYLS